MTYNVFCTNLIFFKRITIQNRADMPIFFNKVVQITKELLNLRSYAGKSCTSTDIPESHCTANYNTDSKPPHR